MNASKELLRPWYLLIWTFARKKYWSERLAQVISDLNVSHNKITDLNVEPWYLLIWTFERENYWLERSAQVFTDLNVGHKINYWSERWAPVCTDLNVDHKIITDLNEPGKYSYWCDACH